VPGGVDTPDQRPEVILAGKSWEKGEHEPSLPIRGFCARRREVAAHRTRRRTVRQVTFSISLPQLDHDGFDDTGFKAYLARAEELGFEGGWTIEQTVGPAPTIAPLELLSYAAAVTTTLRLGVAVLVTSLHDPLQLASAITAVDRLSHGRLDVGVAPGGGFPAVPGLRGGLLDVHLQLHRGPGVDEGRVVG
jgi:hypothetical protein